jgi:hypothetical protein
LGPKFDEEDLGEEDGNADEAADGEDVEDGLEVHHAQRTNLARVLSEGRGLTGLYFKHEPRPPNDSAYHGQRNFKDTNP